MKFKKHQGFALFTSTIFLMLLGLIGVSIMKISLTSVKTAHNDEYSMRSFNQAELALRKGELVLQDLSDNSSYTDFSHANDYLYVFPINQNSINWADGTSAGSDNNGRYVIEYIGSRPIDTESASLNPSGGISGSTIYLSNVISRDHKKETGSRRIIRSSYATFKQP
jgi:Tfp pilus assembly protein PilX